MPGMTIADLHTPDFIVIDAPPCQTLDQGAEKTISLLRSSYSDQYHGQKLTVAWNYPMTGLARRSWRIKEPWKWHGTATAWRR